VAWVGAAALFFTAIISTANVIATKVFGKPIDNVTELVTYLNIPIVFFCIGFVQLDHGHTHIDLIYRHFPKPMHTAIHIIGYVIGVVICGFAGWRGIALAVQKYATSAYAAGPSSFLIWPFVACIGIGYLVLALCFVWCIPRELVGCGPYELGGDDPSSQEGA
jgi:TRAP-type C4-dicarboxylate transport system permease small subunit